MTMIAAHHSSKEGQCAYHRQFLYVVSYDDLNRPESICPSTGMVMKSKEESTGEDTSQKKVDGMGSLLPEMKTVTQESQQETMDGSQESQMQSPEPQYTTQSMLPLLPCTSARI